MTDFLTKKCAACESGVPPMEEAVILKNLAEIEGWEYADSTITRTFSFKNYYETIAFVNSLAFIAHKEDHHPDLEVSYNKCCVRYSTHSIGGISENDFICAAKINALLN